MQTRKTTAVLLAGALGAVAALTPLAASAKPTTPPGRAVGHVRHGKGNGGAKGMTQSCKVHARAYIAAGVLVSDALTKNANGTYSGEVTVEVKRTNHHAASEKGKTVTYKVSEARVVLGFKSASGAKPTVEELKAGDRAMVIGRITFLPRRCNQAEFTPTVTVKRLVFHAAS